MLTVASAAESPEPLANTVANSPEPAEIDFEDLLTQVAEQLAKDTGVSNEPNAVANIVSRIRWYPNQAGAIVIVKRGGDRKVLATISPKSGKWAHLYPSWERALANLQAKKVANGVSRTSHDDLEPGAVPVLAKDEDVSKHVPTR